MSNPAVDAYLSSLAPERRRVAESLRAIIRDTLPDAVERFRPGWGLIGYDVPTRRRMAYFGYIHAEEEHVHLGFEYGVGMDDPDHLMGGTGRQVRYVTLRQGDEIPEAALRRLVRDGARVAASSRAERLTRSLDREVEPPATRR